MCGPALPLVMVGLTVATTAFSAVQRIQSGKAEAAAYKYQERQAQIESALDTNARQRHQAQVQAEQQVLYSGSGFDSRFGTPIDVYGRTAGEFGREQYEADLNTKAKSDLYNFNAKQAKTSGMNNAISTVGSSLSRLYDYGTAAANAFKSNTAKVN